MTTASPTNARPPGCRLQQRPSSQSDLGYLTGHGCPPTHAVSAKPSARVRFPVPFLPSKYFISSLRLVALSHSPGYFQSICLVTPSRSHFYASHSSLCRTLRMPRSFRSRFSELNTSAIRWSGNPNRPRWCDHVATAPVAWGTSHYRLVAGPHHITALHSH